MAYVFQTVKLSELVAKYRAAGCRVIIRGLRIIVDRKVFHTSKPIKNLRNRWQIIDYLENLVGIARSYAKACQLCDNWQGILWGTYKGSALQFGT